VNIYLDTNILVNILLDRDFGRSRAILEFLALQDYKIFVNDITIINIVYITRKFYTKDTIKLELKKLKELIHIVCANSEIIELAFESNFKDFEDGVQYFCAKSVNCDLIITDNKKDFIYSNIDVMDSMEFYNKFIKG